MSYFYLSLKNTVYFKRGNIIIIRNDGNNKFFFSNSKPTLFDGIEGKQFVANFVLELKSFENLNLNLLVNDL